MPDIPYEIERKFLIRFPNMEWLNQNASRSEIVQTYLQAADGSTERVRKRTWTDRTEYTHTVKRKITDMRRIEYETAVPAEEYEALLKKADPQRNVIQKIRYCLPYRNQVFEIDLFPFWIDRAFLELELKDENQIICFPPEIEIIREVTEDGRYTNSALARAIPMEPI